MRKLACRFPAWIAGGASYSSSSKLESYEFRCLITRNNNHKMLTNKWQTFYPIKRLTGLLICFACTSQSWRSAQRAWSAPIIWSTWAPLERLGLICWRAGAMQTFSIVVGRQKWSRSEYKQNSPNWDRNDRIKGWIGGGVEGQSAPFAQYWFFLWVFKEQELVTVADEWNPFVLHSTCLFWQWRYHKAFFSSNLSPFVNNAIARQLGKKRLQHLRAIRDLDKGVLEHPNTNLTF